MSTLAIDIGGTKIAVGLIKDDIITERRQMATPTARSAGQFAEEILTQCSEWLGDVDRIGISTTGLVTPEGISAINPDTLAFPAPFPLNHAIAEQTGKPVEMLNDAQAAAWFEYLALSDKCRNMAYLTVSTGVGGGLVLNGRLHKGRGNLAGHIGHTVIDINGPQCGCGQTGCVEAIASGTAINKAAQNEVEDGISNIDLFARAGHCSKSNAVIERSARAIATLCCNLKASLDLDVVVLGGGVGLAEGYLERVTRHISAAPDTFQVNVVPARGDYDACLLGAAFQFKASEEL